MLKGILIRWAAVVAAVLLSAYLLPDLIGYSSLNAVLVFAVVLALLNTFIRPLLIVATCPITVLSLGLFVLAINALLFWLASIVIPGVRVEGFWGAFVSGLLVSVVSTVANRIVK